MRVLKLNIDVRYYEDGEINGVDDISYEEQEKGVMPRVPCIEKKTVKRYNIWKGTYYDTEEYRWCPEISVDTGEITNWTKGTRAYLHYKVCDGCEFSYQVDDVELLNYNGRDFDGYVPKFLCPGGKGYGDYMIMVISEDGKIEDWDVNEFDNWYEETKLKIRRFKEENEE